MNHCFQAAFHLLRLLAGGLQLILDQVLWPNLPLRLLYGSKLKWLCVALEQITSGIYGYYQLPLTGRRGEASIVDSQCYHDQSDELNRRAPVLYWHQASTPFTYESFKEYLHTKSETVQSILNFGDICQYL